MKILPGFRDFLPELTESEFNQLERNLCTDGCRNPLVVWKGKGILVDGHNRYEICRKHGLSYTVFERDFENESEVRIWIFENQDGQRQLEPFQRIEIAHKLKADYAARAKANQIRKPESVSQNSAKQPPIDTRAELARHAKVSHDTFHKGEKLIEHADEETKEKLRKGETTINREYRNLAKNADAKQAPKRPRNILNRSSKEEKEDPCFMKKYEEMIDTITVMKKNKWTTMRLNSVVHYLEQLIALAAA